MRQLSIAFLLCVVCLSACRAEADNAQDSTQHEHVPDHADCQHAQYCKDCGEQLAEHGEHVYPDVPDAEQDGYAYYECRVCGYLNIINQEGMPVVPAK
jgi:hypothetical protein